MDPFNEFEFADTLFLFSITESQRMNSVMGTIRTHIQNIKAIFIFFSFISAAADFTYSCQMNPSLG
jgi:hypothetical protein